MKNVFLRFFSGVFARLFNGAGEEERACGFQ